MPTRRFSRVALGALVIVVASSLGGWASATPAPRAGAHRVISAARCATNRAAGPITFVSPFAFDASVGILDVFAAQSLGYFKAMCLQVNFVTSSFAPYELVSAGRGTITGSGSAADALTQITNGSHLIALATFGDTSDYALLTNPAVKKLSDLAGKTLGYHTTVPVVLTEMLRRAGVDIARVHEVSLNTYDPNVLPEGHVQALQAYRTNEPLILSAEHDAYREWLPSSFGVRGTFNVVVANARFVLAHPATTGDFLRAELHAFAYCAQHEVSCVRFEESAAKAANQPYDYSHSLAEWRLEVSLVEANTLPGAGYGVQSLAEWRPEAAALIANGIERSLPTLSSVENTHIVASLYRDAKLLWPGT